MKSLEEWNEFLDDDIKYWMNNPFLDAEARASKIVYWLNEAAK